MKWGLMTNITKLKTMFSYYGFKNLTIELEYHIACFYENYRVIINGKNFPCNSLYKRYLAREDLVRDWVAQFCEINKKELKKIEKIQAILK